MVSIITPSYKSAKFIKDTIESVLAQTYQNWEMIIVDDVSPDNSNEIIEEYIKKDSRIKLMKLEKNSGPAVARNRAIQEAKGRFIAFLDADDLWYPWKLEKQIEFMKKNNICFSYSAYETIDESSMVLNKVRIPDKKLNYTELLKENQIGCLTVVYDSNKLGKLYMPNIKKRQDYALWLKILKSVEFGYCCPGTLAQYRILDDSVSSNKLSLIKHNYELFRKVEKLSLISSIYYTGWNIYRKIIQVIK